MANCVLCNKETDKEYSLIKAKYKETKALEREEKIPILGRNYRSDESPEMRKVGETRYYMEQDSILTGGLCEECMIMKRKEDSWFRWYYLIPLAAGGAGMLFGGNIAPIQLFSMFLLFMSLIGIIMGIARTVSHTDEIRIAEAMEGYYLDESKGGDGTTITLRDFIYRPKKNPERFVLFSQKEWQELKSDEKGTYLV